ncbi:MAG: FMN-binding protein [Desulfobacteraceae bacterium]|jgi:Na+-transporting NADH:ubiquinone oxidoreductase subunit C
MSESQKSIVFAVALAIICSVLLTLAATGLRPFKMRNVAIDMQKNVLKSVQLVQTDKSYTDQWIEKTYTENIQCLYVDEAGSIIDEKDRRETDLPLCLYKPEKNIEAYIIPINTRGLWGKIEGYLALEKDGSTVKGFTVYKHNETPGLGGEIEQAWFQKNFQGKKIIDENGDFVSISIAKGVISKDMPQDKRSHYVDGISGATLTGKYLTVGFKEILLEYEPVSIKFRKYQGKPPVSELD